MKLATGAGKTKVMSLLMTWSYFHKLYEPDSPLSTNFLLIAPNIIVLDRLQARLRRSERFSATTRCCRQTAGKGRTGTAIFR